MTTMPKVGAWTTAQTLVWDAWNRLIEVNEGGSDVSTNTYDAFHRRIRKVGGGETRDYYYDFKWRSVEERVGTPGSQTVKAQYTWSPTDRWTMIRRKRSTTSTLNEVLYVLKDYLDPAALFSTATSEIVERFGFDAFGPVRFMDKDFAGIGSSVYDWNFLFHAEFIDQESGLYNYGYRFYHTALGRWLSHEPLEEQEGANLYKITDNNCVSRRDGYGLSGGPEIGLGPTAGVTGLGGFFGVELSGATVITTKCRVCVTIQATLLLGGGALGSAGGGGTLQWDSDGDLEGDSSSIGIGGGAGEGAGATGSIDVSQAPDGRPSPNSGSVSVSPLGPTVGVAMYGRINRSCTGCASLIPLGPSVATPLALLRAMRCVGNVLKEWKRAIDKYRKRR
jgi:RHS repeat-associated protein